jgi:peptidoglycan-N-acetylglucosamine deacetylase
MRGFFFLVAIRMTKFHWWLVACTLVGMSNILFPHHDFFFSVVWVVLLSIFAWGVASIRSRFFGPVLLAKPEKPTAIALTFDDGPDPYLTHDILAILDKYRIKATFFVSGRRVREYPGIVRKCFEQGHLIACHDYTHSPWANFRMTGRLVRDLSLARQEIYRCIGMTPNFYRPPMGLMNPHVPKALRRMKMICVGWSARAVDAGNRRRDGIKKIHLLARNGGQVVLLHDVLPRPEFKGVILHEIDMLCESLSSQGLTAYTIEEMFSLPGYACNSRD